MPEIAASQVIATVTMDANAVTTVINNINSLYSNVFTFVAALVALGGVVFPLFLTRYQSRRLKTNHNLLTSKIIEEIDAAKAQLIVELKEELRKELLNVDQKFVDMKNELSTEINENAARAEAKTHHIQGRRQKSNKNYVGAFIDFSVCVECFFKAKEEDNMQIALRDALGSLEQLNKADIDSNNLEKRYNRIIKTLEAANINRGYAENIKTIKDAFKEARERVKEQ